MNDINPAFVMPDVQSSVDTRQIVIQRVGVKGVRYPLSLKTPAGVVATVGTFDLAMCACRRTRRARIVLALRGAARETTAPRSTWPRSARCWTTCWCDLEADAGRIEVTFPYFISKTAPVSGVESLMDYAVTLTGEVRDGQSRLWLTALVPVTSLCPCSKKISQYGAHNQRARTSRCAWNWLATCPWKRWCAWPRKRRRPSCGACSSAPTRRFVTERAYENPKFVEDLVQDIVMRLNADARIVAARWKRRTSSRSTITAPTP